MILLFPARVLRFGRFLPILLAIGSAAHGADAPLTFNRDIRPILSDKCFACHGFDSSKRKAELRLDTAEGILGKGESGEIVIKPGDPAGSEFWKRIVATDKDDVMPPPKSHKSLNGAEKETLRRWIAQGAPFQKHWAFEPPVKAALETMGSVGRIGPIIRNELDGFIQGRLQREGLAATPEADKATLIRRVTIGLTGLPPALREVDAFLADPSPDAYEKVVDRLLGSVHYGEQMARHWLDVARYGDTHGLHYDNERSMWPYRDWVVTAFNRNLSFKQFTIEQLAGDLLPNATPDQVVATGFNRCNITTGEGGAIDAEYRFIYAVDRTSTTAQTWMGLTAGCAVCHDHKFDPLTQKEFYQLYAFFNSSADPAMDGNAFLTAPTIKLPTPEEKKRLADFDARLKRVSEQITGELAKITYIDPASIVPPPPARDEVLVLVEDDFPEKAVVTSVGNPLTWITKKNGPVSSGARSLRISGKAMTQDYYQSGAEPIVIPPNGRFSFMVFLDPAEAPGAVMLQFHTSAWKHRAVWGDIAAINFGTINTTERFSAGPLPETGKWVQLEVESAKIGLNPGDKVVGIAFTLHAGTAHFDKLVMTGRIDDATDPSKSLLAWIKPREGKDTKGLPGEVNKIFKTEAAKRTAEQQKQLRDYYFANVCAATKPLFAPFQAEEAKVKGEREALDDSIPGTFVMKDMEKPRDSFIMQRGAYNKPGELVLPGVPAAFPALIQAQGTETVPAPRPTRLDLANWLVADNHPLTARVTVNRFWQQFFGVGLVKSAGDFGSQGESPSHPELLDWLAVSFRETGWDIKKLVRLMVTSGTYRQAATAPDLLWKRDPYNRLLARGPRLRLDAEELRDGALAVSGLLNLTVGGKGVRPYQPPNIWEPVGFVGSNTRFYKADSGSALYRRSLYTFFKRTAPPPFMINFDAPPREQSCVFRERSNTPLQALQLMNDVQYIEAARAFAERLMAEGGNTPEEKITFAYRTALARSPAPAELAIVMDAFKQHMTAYQQKPEAAGKLIRQGESKPKVGIPEPELAAWTLIANLVLNLDEVISRQ